ncbi:hypothetical protein TSOC_004513 [Tetrabaena socialis]|uniref:Uncharacterized protein n=1 Tax=Tetrabaena socialis TaxID=47790 RepID=A0A2J8A8V1_9CHLO|nr:hypothetical protein TSOC_004513 [Tetrabaena socialis]|eukprot:PNH08925.1 hypothetical protein TSOC_004513 [Tetrabaena socialis]
MSSATRYSSGSVSGPAVDKLQFRQRTSEETVRESHHIELVQHGAMTAFCHESAPQLQPHRDRHAGQHTRAQRLPIHVVLIRHPVHRQRGQQQRQAASAADSHANGSVAKPASTASSPTGAMYRLWRSPTSAVLATVSCLSGV